MTVNPKLDAAFFETVAARLSALPLRELLSECIVKVSHCDGRAVGAIFATLQRAFASAKNNEEDLDLRLYDQPLCYQDKRLESPSCLIQCLVFRHSMCFCLNAQCLC